MDCGGAKTTFQCEMRKRGRNPIDKNDKNVYGFTSFDNCIYIPVFI